jgi:hypothetical protein
MIRKPIVGALFATATLFATGAYGEDPHAAAPAAAAAKADKGDKGDKGDKKADKGDKGDKNKGSDADKAKTPEERAARKLKEQDREREKLKAILKAPMDDATRQELRHHAERIARLERIRAVAQQEKDTATVDKVTALIAKENDRSDKWLAKHTSTPPATPAAVPAPVPAPTATDDKAGAK